MVIFLIVVIGLSVLILGHEAGHFFAAKLFGIKVDEFGFGFPPRIFGRKKGETEYSLNWLPFGGFVKIAGEYQEEAVREEDRKKLFLFQPLWKKITVVAAGVFMNFVLGWILLSVVLMIGLPTALLVDKVQPNSPAETAGIKNGDIITGFTSANDFINFINGNKGKEINLKLRRGNENIAVRATPRVVISPREGALGVFFAEGGEEKRGFFPAIAEGLRRSFLIFYKTAIGLFALVKNLLIRGSLLDGVVGPVGIFTVAYNTGGLGLAYLGELMALISLNLTIVNLIPFPALDGGRLLLFLVEKIKGSPLPRKFETYTNAVGFAILLALMILLTVRDVGGLL